MTAFIPRIVSSPRDMLLLTLGLVLWLGAGLVAWHFPAWTAAAYLALLELLFIGWAAGTSDGRRGIAVGFALKTHLTVASRMAVAIAVSLLSTGLVLWLLNLAMRDPVLERVAQDPRAILALQRTLKFLVLCMPFVSAWYLHALQARGLAFADLASGAFLQATLRMSSPAIKVQQRLDFYLRALASELSAPLPTSIYGVRPTLTGLAADDGKALYECAWTWLPVKLVIEVRPDGEDAAVIVSRCALRGGYYRHEMAVLPNEALMLLEHLQIHVLQPLRADMAQGEAERRQETLRLQAMEMRLKVLQAQVEPHFLFNTMANLRQLYRTDVMAGENMLNHLISYLRGAMDGLRTEHSSVGAELALTRHYLAIMKVRMGARLSYTLVNIDDIEHLPFPPAMLISLVENAIKHGLQDRRDGQLRIVAACEGGKLKISVIDNGPGFGSIEGTGVGLSNIRQRLEARYGHEAWLEAGALSEGGFSSTIVVPFDRYKEQFPCQAQ